MPTARSFQVSSAIAFAIGAAAIGGNGCAAHDGSTSAANSSTANGAYDVLVIGAGAGGGPLASRLARAGKRVLLLEAGGDVAGDKTYEVPARHAFASEDPSRAWSYFVQHHSDATLDARDSKYVAAEKGVLYPRGSALGGSTAVNAMVTVLPPPTDWDRVASITGDPSFRAANMGMYVDRVHEWLPEELADTSLALGDPVVTGFLGAAAHVVGASGGDGAGSDGDGGLATTPLAELLGPNVNDSLANGETTGLFRLPFATSDGHRRGARERIVDTVDGGFPLTVMLHAFVTKVRFDTSANPPRAIGVEYRQGTNLFAASAGYSKSGFDAASLEQVDGGEIVVSAGSFNSPALLQLSGVGDPALLTKLGIPVVAARTGVGHNLQDRYEAGIIAEMDAPIDLIANCNLAGSVDPCQDSWDQGQGVYRTPGFLATMLTRSTPDLAQADLQIFSVPTDARGYYPGYSLVSAKAKNLFSWLILKAHTSAHSGFVAVESTDASARPHIQTNVFEGPGAADDLAAMVQAIHLVRNVHSEFRTANPSLGFHELWPGPSKATDADLAQFVKDETWGHHVCCTDAMGVPSDPDAVVDSHFRVIGTSNLRVVDASVFPEIPGTFIALPLYMLAEKAAATMLEDLP